MNKCATTSLNLVIEPEPGNAHEVEGVLNPGVARGPDGELYLFPRLVAAGNFSRIGIMRVRFDDAGDPVGVERLGVALEPEAPYELRPDGGGCEDARVTFVEPLQLYVMTYTAFSPVGPRIALAVSEDLLDWNRLGLANFEPYRGIDFNSVDNKDASVFPVAIPNPSGQPELAMLHRPLFPGSLLEDVAARDEPCDVNEPFESIWISYSSLGVTGREPDELSHFTSHHRLATPVAPWERLKIGGGPPPVKWDNDWMLIYHGVSSGVPHGSAPAHLTYRAGLMVLCEEHPQDLVYRSAEPILEPDDSPGPRGTPANVVFPTGLDHRTDLGQPNRYDVYYGMNDYRIKVARLDVPDDLVSDSTPTPARDPDSSPTTQER